MLSAALGMLCVSREVTALVSTSPPDTVLWGVTVLFRGPEDSVCGKGLKSSQGSVGDGTDPSPASWKHILPTARPLLSQLFTGGWCFKRGSQRMW